MEDGLTAGEARAMQREIDRLTAELAASKLEVERLNRAMGLNAAVTQDTINGLRRERDSARAETAVARGGTEIARAEADRLRAEVASLREALSTLCDAVGAVEDYTAIGSREWYDVQQALEKGDSVLDAIDENGTNL